MLFSSLQFIVICYSRHRKLTHCPRGDLWRCQWCYSSWVTSPSQTQNLYEFNLSTYQPTSLDERTSPILDTVAVTKQDGWQPGAQSGQGLSQQTELASLVVFNLLVTRQSEDLDINLLRPLFDS